jgi:hypothetical protein
MTNQKDRNHKCWPEQRECRSLYATAKNVKCHSHLEKQSHSFSNDKIESNSMLQRVHWKPIFVHDCSQRYFL